MAFHVIFSMTSNCQMMALDRSSLEPTSARKVHALNSVSYLSILANLDKVTCVFLCFGYF